MVRNLAFLLGVSVGVGVALAASGCRSGHGASSGAVADRPEATMQLSGALADDRGRAIAGAQIAVYAPDSFRAERLVQSGRDGRFAVQLPPGDYIVSATARDHLAAAAPVERASAREASVRLVLPHAAGMQVHGTIRDPAGAVVAGALVRAERWSSPTELYYAVSDGRGEYAMSLPAGSPHALAVDPGAYVSLPTTIATTGDTVVDFTAYAWPAVSAPASDAVVAWMRSQALPLASVEPGAGFADLARVGDLIGGARVVGLGEATHGTHEFFTLRHRLIEYLVEEHGFTAVAIEASLPEATAIDDYVLHGTGDPAEALAGLHFWIMDTEEVRALIDWMRRYNADPAHERKLRFYGFDMQFASYAASHTLAYFERRDPAHLELARAALGGFVADDWRQAFGALPDDERRAARRRVAGLREHLDAERRTLTRPGPAEEAEWRKIRQFVTVIEQRVHTLALEPGDIPNHLRDQAMADNVRWILDGEGERGRVVLWAANGHVSRHSADGGVPSMGSRLAASLGRDYFAMALVFGQGAFQARDGKSPGASRGVVEHVVGAPAAHFVEAALERTGHAQLVLGLRDIPSSGPVADWLAWPHPLREYGAMFLAADYPWFFALLTQHYDAIAFVARTTRARPTPTGRRGPGQ